MQEPRLYALFLLWKQADLYETLPEVGDPDIPRLVFFFDEAHLLFKDAPKALLEKIEQVVRLIRSKGVGGFFVTQNPLDIPDAVLGQLGNRVQHALRAFTPRDQKAVRSAAQTMRPNPGLDLEAAITELGVGEALVSLLDEKGRPGVTERAWMLAPASRIGPATEAERAALRAASPLGAKYDKAVDRESAYEALAGRAQGVAPADAAQGSGAAPAGSSSPASSDGGVLGVVSDFLFGSTGPRGGRHDGLVQSTLKSVVRREASQLLRGVLGSLVRRR
jgi:DNA helicase HerA-like ATPase